jgi:uncharacterized protein YcnI
MSRTVATVVVAVATFFVPALARAHISISGVGIANTNQEVAFGVGHGCAGADTYRVRVEIPTGVTSALPMRSDFGKPTVEKNTAGIVTAVVWQKADTELHDADISYYKLVIRMRVPNQPFTTVYFPTQQTCRAANGTMTTVEWKMLPTDPVVDGGADEPAPALKIVPARRPGWNKYTAPSAMSDLSVYFGDALIVWKSTAAYSASPTTVELIAGTPGVTPLTSLAANDEIWVKY